MVDRFVLFFFNDTATTEIYTLSLHDALPIFRRRARGQLRQLLHLPVRGRGPARGDAAVQAGDGGRRNRGQRAQDRKSTRLNSSHANISYAVFCLKKKT